MTAGTHLLAGVVTALSLNLPIFPALLGSIAPDIDLKKGLPFRQNRTLFNSHRGITHHIFIPFTLFILSLFLKDFVNPVLGIYALSFSIGYASHLLLDALNPLGIPYTFRYYPRFSLKLMKSGRLGELFVILTLVALLFYEVKGNPLTLKEVFGI